MTPEQSRRLAHALADEIAYTLDDVTAYLLRKLAERPRSESRPDAGMLLGLESGWLGLVWRALEVAELADGSCGE